MKKVVVVLLTVFLVLAVAACGSNSSQPAAQPQAQNGSGSQSQTQSSSDSQSKDNTGKTSKVDEIKARGELIVGLSADYPPYESHEIINGEDKIVGFDIDLAQAIADELGVKLHIVDTSFNGLIPMLQANKIDVIISGMTATEERAKSVDFSDIYFSGKNLVLVKKDSNIATIDDLKDKLIAVQLGTTQEAAAQKAGMKTKPINLLTDAVMELKNGKVDAVLATEVVAKKFVSMNDDIKSVYIKELADEGGGSAAAVAKGNKDLVEVINKVLKDLKDSGKYDEMVNKWFGA
ncbi:basic amino acid ABC transporter substrate-binding protein [Calorimonas adulescens]|uniref:Basic amino acid ABC transporter substrate-binding protein n=1 Tax=Calorimonas adulescens TaxID=2606906 RepID=A0A5D8QGE4_9THEO|nr:basic amino acid ABC transporter substrate-binding protein [Calorimonas adulescens]TZE82593.1 basic amino acid ABC transporter substrate-binding protein [Calorimonas adulescens]